MEVDMEPSSHNGDSVEYSRCADCVKVDGVDSNAIPQWLSIPFGVGEVKDTKLELNSLVMNYLLMEGHKEAAEAFARESQTEPNVSLSYLEERIRIREAVCCGNIIEAVALVNSLDSSILESFPNVYFKLKRQQLIEIIRSGDYVKAVEYAQSDLASFGEENQTRLHLLEETMALLLHKPPSESSPFAHLMTRSQMEGLSSELNSAIMRHFDLPECSGLQRMLQTIGYTQDTLKTKKSHHYTMSPLGKMGFTGFQELSTSD